MVDFKKFHEKWWNELPEEDRVRITQHKELEMENTFYATNTLLDDDYQFVKYNGKREEERQEVKLYRYVDNENKVHPKLLLSFGGYRQYTFDGRFVNSILERLEDANRRFCIDAGREVYVKNVEMQRIIKESVEALKQRGEEVVDDYDPEFTNSSMGKMLVGMGLW